MNLRGLVGSQTAVALKFAKPLLLHQARDSNVVFSPLSIHVVLSLVTAGSGGATRDQLLSFLNTKSTDHLNSFASELVSLVFTDGSSAGGPLLSFANGVWLDQSLSLKPSFKHVVDTAYKAAHWQADFQKKAGEVAAEVNSWAEKKTSGLIKELLPPGAIDNTTRLVLANALYFKGAWDEKFNPSATKDHEFHLLDGNSVRVPFMTSKKKQFVAIFDGLKVLSLPYKQGENKRSFSMMIFLPDAKDGLPALVEKIGSQSGFLDRHLPNERVGVGKFRIPRFKVSFGFEASDLLKGLGLVLPFSDEGGLTEMVDSSLGSSLYVSKIFHKSFLEVNEEGTEAAAATASVIAGCSMFRQEEINFVVDHPFLFVVRENVTGTLLFAGQVLNPLASSG